MSKKLHSLVESDIAILKSNGCICSDWTRILVMDGFDPAKFQNVSFSGDITLGAFNSKITENPGVEIPTGVINAQLHNCFVGSNVLIKNIGDYIANYSIEDNVIIIDCSKIFTEGLTSFGNGIEVSVMDETGGRAVKMWDRLSSHEAYISAFYRHRGKVTKAINKLADNYSAEVTSGKGVIGRGSKITNCKTIRNVKIGEGSRIDGSLLLNDGSVNSTEEAPVYIGPGVIMKNFIACSGSEISDSAQIENCFIGEGCIISKSFSAVNSLFFSNSEGLLGEACSVFAGPYTVTHHKSTLLIGGYFSFMNAGSGTNQSNHMYKLGPVHHGIMERGSKTSSGSYIMWPARIGSFTFVMGRHYKNPDTSSFPFSYLIEGKERSILIPGVNMKSVGTYRDINKWPSRDRRKTSKKIDKINFEMFSPYTVRKMVNGRNLLKQLKDSSSNKNSVLIYNNLEIKYSSVERGIELYQAGIDKFIGESLINRLLKAEIKNSTELNKLMTPDDSAGLGDWADLAGLLVPQNEIEQILDGIESSKIKSATDLSSCFENLYRNYKIWSWNWVCDLIREEKGITISKLSKEEIIQILGRWKESNALITSQIIDDAGKEFALSSAIGFGIDGDEIVKQKDFTSVRGIPDTNKIVSSIKEQLKNDILRGEELISRINKLVK
jgi:hypothetical protein